MSFTSRNVVGRAGDSVKSLLGAGIVTARTLRVHERLDLERGAGGHRVTPRVTRRRVTGPPPRLPSPRSPGTGIPGLSHDLWRPGRHPACHPPGHPGDEGDRVWGGVAFS